jgi:hypothetical protein
MRNAARFVVMTIMVVIAHTAMTAPQGNGTTIGTPERDAIVEALARRLTTGYVLPDRVNATVLAMRTASAAGDFGGKAPKEFGDALNRTLRARGHGQRPTYQPRWPPHQVRGSPAGNSAGG